MTTYIADTEHYSEVVARMCKARRLLWIATADLKDLYVMQGTLTFPKLRRQFLIIFLSYWTIILNSLKSVYNFLF